MRDEAVLNKKEVKELMNSLTQHAQILTEQILLNVLKTGELVGVCRHYDSSLGRVVLMVVCGYFTPKSLAAMTQLDEKVIEASVLVEARRALTNTTFQYLQEQYPQEVAAFEHHAQ